MKLLLSIDSISLSRFADSIYRHHSLPPFIASVASVCCLRLLPLFIASVCCLLVDHNTQYLFSARGVEWGARGWSELQKESKKPTVDLVKGILRREIWRI